MAERVDAPSVSPRLAAFIATRDKRIAEKQPWSPTTLRDLFHELIARGDVTVGGRSSCGGTVDPTWVTFTSWNEVIRKARQEGFVIEEESIKHGNGWATVAGGFWSESKYRLTSTPEESAVVAPLTTQESRHV